MNSRNSRRAWILLASGVAVAILLGWKFDVLGIEVEEGEDPAGERTAEIPAAALIERSQVPEAESEPTHADAQCFGKLVDASGGLLGVNGTARLELGFSDQPTIAVDAEVEGGEFPIHLEHHLALSTRSFTVWRLSFWSDQVARSEATEFSVPANGERHEIHFVLPPARTIEVRVTDLRGEPIPGAVVDCDSRSGWAHWGHGEVRTDDEGIARFTLHAAASPISLRASKPGYATSTAVDSGETAALTMQLRRLLAVCIVRSKRVVLQESATVNVSSSMLGIRPDDFASLTARHEAEFPLQEDEVFQWEIHGEMVWQEDTRYTVSYSGWFGGPLGTVTYPLRFLADEKFEIFRIPEDILEQVEPLHEVWFDLTPAEQLLAPPPERLQFQVEAADPAHDLKIPFDELHATPRFYMSPWRISGTRYRGFLPPGEFTILARGCDWQPRRPHRDPALLHDVRFAVAATPAIPLVALTLHPGESFVRQRFVDVFGRPLDLEAVLLPEDASLGDSMIGFMPVSGHPHLDRFVRPGFYSLWINDPSHYGSVRYPARYAWDGQANADGSWDVVIDLAPLDPTLRLR